MPQTNKSPANKSPANKPSANESSANESRAAPARRKRAEALAVSLQAITRKAIGQRSLAEAGLIADWPAIVGAETARVCWPRALQFPHGKERRAGTLIVRVKPGQAPRIGHREPIILDQVNGYFGYQAAARLRLEQGPPPRGAARTPPPAPAPPAPAATAAAERRTGDVQDPDLRAALARLGARLETGAAPDTTMGETAMGDTAAGNKKGHDDAGS